MNYTEKNKLLDKISVIGLMAILVEVFLYGIDNCFTNQISDWLLKMSMFLSICGGVFLVVAITLYIIAYKRANFNKAIYATEFLALAFICPFLTYWYTKSGPPLNQISPKVLWIVVLVYYIIRIAYTCIKAFKQSTDTKSKKKKNK